MGVLYSILFALIFICVNYMVDYGLGSISRARLYINSSTSTTWYIPMVDYVGTIYVSQINGGGSLAASFVLNVNANASGSPSYGLSTGAIVGYNTTRGANYGLQFSNINLYNYSLVVMFVGTNAGDFTFQNYSP